jgi:SAM-dependent methyltransferase
LSWQQLGEWWLEELSTDPSYAEEIGPLLLDLLQPKPGALYLDAGCGDGRMMKLLSGKGARVVGCDFNLRLLSVARQAGPVVRAELPALGWARSGAFDGAVVGLVLEHLADEGSLFTGVAGAVRSGGILALVINHPVWTAPGSSPFEDTAGEVLWRPGKYFGRGYSDEPAGRQTVRFYHRTMADVLNAASDAGWDLRRLEERGVSPQQIARTPDYAGQEHIPRLLGARWERR